MSYQQKLSQEYVINNYSCTSFPPFPLEFSDDRLENNVMICLDETKMASIESLKVARDMAISLENMTITQRINNLWHLLRSKGITVSNYGRVAKRKANYETLVNQLNPSRKVVTQDMRRGIELESTAAMVYANEAMKDKVNLFPLGLSSTKNVHGLAVGQIERCMTWILKLMGCYHLDY